MPRVSGLCRSRGPHQPRRSRGPHQRANSLLCVQCLVFSMASHEFACGFHWETIFEFVTVRNVCKGSRKRLRSVYVTGRPSEDVCCVTLAVLSLGCLVLSEPGEAPGQRTALHLCSPPGGAPGARPCGLGEAPHSEKRSMELKSQLCDRGQIIPLSELVSSSMK